MNGIIMCNVPKVSDAVPDQTYQTRVTFMGCLPACHPLHAMPAIPQLAAGASADLVGIKSYEISRKI